MRLELVLGVLGFFLSAAAATVLAQEITPKLDQFNLSLTLLAAIPEPLDDPADPPGFFQVKPQEFDPANSHLVQAAWQHGTGCPTSQVIQSFNPVTFQLEMTTYMDPACRTGDPRDDKNRGLLLVKTGPTNNNAAAVAELKKVKGIMLTELGYDIRKQGGSLSALGSHCGAGAPRFNVLTTDGFFGVGCTSPPPNSETLGNGWTRLRWGAAGVVMGFKDFTTLMPITGTVKRITIIFDEGQDTGGDFFGAAILDNIDVNGALVGRGASDAD